MPSDQLSPEGDHRYVKMQSEPPIAVPSSHSFRLQEHPRIFDELPKADIVSVSRPDARDISPMLLSYTVEFRYKQFKWRLVKKASQVLCLHLTLEKRAFIEELHEKQEQVKEWLQNLGLGEHTPVVQDDEPVTLAQEENLSTKSRWLSRPHRLRQGGGDITSAASGEGGRRRIRIIEGERHKIFRFSLFFRLIPLGSERRQSKSTVTDQFQMVTRRKQPQSTIEGWCNAFPPHRSWYQFKLIMFALSLLN